MANIAIVTVTFNDGYKIDEWCEWFHEYETECYKHIIVDNGSSQDYLQKVRHLFPQSIIIERTSNGGSTSAYNDGIKEALKDSSVDAIMLLGNDIRLKKGSITKMYNYLFQNEHMGMVAPVLLNKDSDVVFSSGMMVHRHLLYLKVESLDFGEKIDKISRENKVVDYVIGGCNMSKRTFYEKVGLQDEKLFMFGDELDMFFRASKSGFQEGVAVDAIAWHQHINVPKECNGLDLRRKYLQARNHYYIYRKNMAKNRADLLLFGAVLKAAIICVIKHNKKAMHDFSEVLKGAYDAKRGVMYNDKIWIK